MAFDERVKGLPVRLVDLYGNDLSSGAPVSQGASVPDVVTLLSNASATGTGQTVAGGKYIWDAVGTFGGATLTLQYISADGSTYVTVPNATLTAAGPIELDVAVASTIKCVVTGGSPGALYSKMRRV